MAMGGKSEQAALVPGGTKADEAAENTLAPGPAFMRLRDRGTGEDTPKENFPSMKPRKPFFLLVPRGRIELPTRGFSVQTRVISLRLHQFQ